MEELAKKAHFLALLDAYEKLLNPAEKQRLSEHYGEDYSFAEIAQRENTSRNAVYLSIVAAQKKLEKYEKALGLVAFKKQLAMLIAALPKAKTPAAKDALIAKLWRIIDDGL